MYKGLNGYLTVEASFVMPIVICIYVLFILSGFYLYNRCVISQDNYLLAFRGSRFTDSRENYGEVIYEDMQMREPDRGYLEERLAYKAQFYPFYHWKDRKIGASSAQISVETAGYNGALKIKKHASRINILEVVERTRR